MANEYDALLADEQPAADAGEPANPYAAILADEATASRATLRAGATLGLDSNPDEVARQKRVASLLGRPLAAVEALPKESDRDARLAEIERATTGAPVLQAKFSDEDFSKLAHDNVESMGAIERMLRSAAAGLTFDPSSATYGALETVAKTGADALDPAFRLFLPENPLDRFGLAMEDYRKNQQAAADRLAGPPASGFTEQAIASGFRSFGQMAPGLALSVATGNPGFALGSGSLMQGSQSATKALDKGAAPATALTYGLEDAAAEYATEMLPVGALLKDLKAGAPLYKVLAHQIATEVPTELAATAWQNFNEWMNLNPEKSASDYIEQLGPDEAQTVIATITTSVLTAGLGRGAHAVVNRLQERDRAAQQAEQSAALVQQLAQLAAADKVLARDPGTFHQFIADASENGPLTHVYIDAGQLMQSGVAEQVAAASPSVAAQLPAAAQSGGQVQIPIEDYLTNIAPQEGAEVLLDHLKTEPGGFSRAEAAEYVKTQGDELRAEVERVLADHEADATFKDSAAAVRTEVKRQLDETARFTPEVNDAYASMIGNFYAVTAARANVTPEDLFQRYPLQVAAERVVGGGIALALDQGEVPKTDQTDELTGLPLNEDGTVTVYHHTSAENAEKIRESRMLRSAGEPDLYFTTTAETDTGYGDTVIPVRVNPARLQLDDEFPSGRKDVRVAAPAKGRRLRLLPDGSSALNQPEGWDSIDTFDPSSPDPLKPNVGSRGTYNPANRTIALLQNADLTTFLHEAGHHFLEVMADLASRQDAPAQIRQDMDAVLKWFGVKDLATWRAMSIDEQRPFHEQFARGFEAYLFEGNAPNAELNGLFQRVRAWMLAVYRDIKALHVELTDEVRGVFDRMLATTDAIQAAESARRMMPLFENAAAAGMTMEEFKAYHALGIDATNEAIQELQARSLKDMTWTSKLLERTTRRLNKEARSKRKEVRAEVAAELIKQPVFAAGEWLRTGKVTNDAGETTTTEGVHKLAVDPIAAEFPATANNPVPWHSLGYDRDGMLSKDGLDPDLVAEQFGFSSGSELVRKLVAAGSYRDAVEAATDRRMLERYGDLNSPEAIARATEEAVHNAVRARFVETEANALAKLAGKRKVLVSAARDYAGQMIARLRIRDVRPAQFSASEAKAAAATARAVKEGRLDEAAEAKRAQLIQAQAARAALQAQSDIEKGLRYLKRFRGNVANLDAGYLDQIHALLERFDLRQVSERDAVRRMAFTKWLEEQRQAGFEPDIPPELESEALRLPYKEMTVEEFRGLVDTVKQIEHLGRLKSRLLTARKTRAYEAARAEIVESIDEHSQGREANTRTPTTRAGRVAQNLRRFWAAHIKAATWARVMDGGHDAGAMWEYFIRGANERGDKETRMRAEATRRLTDILMPVLTMGKMGGKGQFFPSINRSLNREARITIALNWGNEGNRQRLLGGEGWTEQQVIPVLQTLSGADWRAVQAIWDHFESYRPAIAAKERRVYGKEPNWVDPSPFTLHTDAGYDVELRGGYYPIKFDPNASQRAEEHADAEGAKRELQGAYTSATTRRSFTKKRVTEVKGRPLLYTLAGVYSGVNDVIHDLCWHEWLIDTNRLLRSSAIDEAIREHYGPEVKAQFKDWSRDIAEGDRGAANAGDIAATWLRRSISVSGLGFNIMSALMQPLGITQSMVRVGTPWVARGITRYIAHPIELTRQVNSMSSFMEERARTRLRELNELRNQVQDHAIAKERIGRYAYFLMMRCQQMVDVPTWWGAYEKAIAGGNEEDRARALADQAVIDAQGSGMTKDLSAIERGGPVQRLFTVFYSFMNTALNLGVERTMSADTPAKRARLAVDYLMLFVVPAVLGQALKNAVTPDDDDDDDLGKLLLRLAGAEIDYLMGLMVGVREFGEAAKTAVGGGELGHDYQGPAGVRGIVDLTKLVQQAHQGEFDDAFRKAAVNVLGDFTGLPAAQINRTVTGVQALSEGKTDNPAAIVFGFQAKH